MNNSGQSRERSLHDLDNFGAVEAANHEQRNIDVGDGPFDGIDWLPMDMDLGFFTTNVSIDELKSLVVTCDSWQPQSFQDPGTDIVADEVLTSKAWNLAKWSWFDLVFRNQKIHEMYSAHTCETIECVPLWLSADALWHLRSYYEVALNYFQQARLLDDCDADHSRLLTDAFLLNVSPRTHFLVTKVNEALDVCYPELKIPCSNDSDCIDTRIAFRYLLQVEKVQVFQVPYMSLLSEAIVTPESTFIRPTTT